MLDVGFRDLAELKEIASLASLGGYVLGIDLDDEAVERAARELASDPDERIEVRHGSILEIPVPDPTFDLIYCKGILHEVRLPERALAELRRVCVDDGMVVLIDFQKFSRIKFEFYRLKARIRGKPCPNHHPGFSKDRIIRLANGEGFRIHEYRELSEHWRMGTIEAFPFLLKISPELSQPTILESQGDA